MNRGTGDNIMTQLGMTSDQYNLLTVLYYVRIARLGESSNSSLTGSLDPVHRCRGAVKSSAETIPTITMAITDHGNLGCNVDVPRGGQEQGRTLRHKISPRAGKFFAPRAKPPLKTDNKFRPKRVSSQELFCRCAIGTAPTRCHSDFFISVSSSELLEPENNKLSMRTNKCLV